MNAYFEKKMAEYNVSWKGQRTAADSWVDGINTVYVSGGECVKWTSYNFYCSDAQAFVSEAERYARAWAVYEQVHPACPVYVTTDHDVTI